MSIIRKLAVLIIAIISISALMPRMAKADEGDSNEINIKNNLDIRNGIFLSDQDKSLGISAENFEGFQKPEISPEEQARIDYLSKFADKINSALLPQGKFKINASAYTASADECGKTDGITASGLKVRENETIACPSRFPFGVKMNIVGIGTFVCEDRGGAIKGNHIDIYMENKSDAFAFGRQNLEAEIVM